MANPNPSPSTRFGAGISGNPAGKSSRQRELEYSNAELALEIRGILLERLRASLEDETALDDVLRKVDLLRLLRDTEDRGLGTPKASIDVTASGDVRGLIDLSRLSNATLAELVEAHDGAQRHHADTSTASA